MSRSLFQRHDGSKNRIRNRKRIKFLKRGTSTFTDASHKPGQLHMQVANGSLIARKKALKFARVKQGVAMARAAIQHSPCSVWCDHKGSSNGLKPSPRSCRAF